MPYIKQVDRVELSEGRPPLNAGELNYRFTQICTEYILTHGLKYSVLNDCVGALEGAKLELYRRVAAPYEDVKIKANGDVYPKEGGF